MEQYTLSWVSPRTLVPSPCCCTATENYFTTLSLVKAIPALPHEPHVPPVVLADEEVHVEVGQVHLCDVVVAADELLDRVQALYLEVLVLDVLVGSAEINASPHLVGALLRNGEEGAPEAVGGLWW